MGRSGPRATRTYLSRIEHVIHDCNVNENQDIYALAAELAASHSPFVLITVIRTQGSSPREPGAKMLWRPGRGLLGTVGGGQFEYLALDAAARCHDRRTSATERFVLGADADQCCGGVMEVFLEYHGPRQRVVIFGAGHVAQSLAGLLEAAPIEVVIADDRADWNTTERFPRARRVLTWDEGVAISRENPGATLACVMTCSHDTDLELLRNLLVKPPAFVGLIGSKSKRACLFGRLVASGIDDELVKKIRCPIGVGDTGKEPQLVAISIAAQLLMEAKSLACL